MILAAMGGGLGKTTVALGLAGTWRRHGVRVLPYKKGPDYIDSAWLGRICGEPCRNLDTYMVPAPVIYERFARMAGHGGVALIEGNRGLYDGMDDRGTFSTGELAKQLLAPVVLVVNCAKVTRTVAAVVMGAQTFDPDVPLRGVILNQVSSERHERTIRRAIEDHCGLPVFGAIPRLKRPPLSDRHLGVVPPVEDPALEESLEWAVRAVEEHVDWRALLKLASEAATLEVSGGDGEAEEAPADGPRIGILRDAAFQFYYPENIEALEELGAQIVPISAISDERLPQIDALYIGGGFPETCAAELAANEAFRRSVRDAAEAGLPIYAECGGLMYLGRSLELSDGSHEMVGLFPFRFAMEERPVAHGYTALRVSDPNPFYPAGTSLKGHEFHHSRLLDYSLPPEAKLVLSMQRGSGIEDKREGILYRNTLALYTHVHALGTPQWAEGLVNLAREWRKG